MAPYEAFDDDTEVHGRTILRVVDDALARFADPYRETARDALAEHGIDDPSPDEWYLQQAWLDTFAAIAATLEPHILDRLGEQIPDAAEWPDDPASVAEGLRTIDDAYRRNHRGGDIGSYRFDAAGDREAEVTCRNPYPCPFDRGLIRAVARQHAPVESFVFVEERGDRCRREGDDVCVYTVSW
jgi:hypothetical protein